MKQIVSWFAVLLFASSGHSCWGQDSPQAREQLAEQLYDAQGLGRMPYEAYRQWKMSGGQFREIAEHFPQITAADWDALFRTLYEADQPAMKKQFVAFIAARFDSNELAQINTFYASAAGRKLLAAVPEIFAQSAQTRTDNDTRPVVHKWVVEMTKKYHLE